MAEAAMRIDSVSLVNFGSHAAKTWEPGDARLTVVTGPNGAGKSTLLVDAPLFALFGDVPDGSGPDQLVRIGATDMSATLEFTLDGRRYRFIRRRTVRAGGKTSADAQVQLVDGSWKPLASGAREVSAEASRLLRMDQHTFRTAVILAQGDAKRFMDATPGKGTPAAPGRAAILSTLVVDPAFALAEAKARDEARDLEATTAADRGQRERLSDAIAELEPMRDQVTRWGAQVHDAAQRQTAAAAERDGLQGMLVDVGAKLAAGASAETDVTRLEGERAGMADRYRREQKAIADAAAAADAARATMANAGDVDQAIADVPSMRLEVEGLEKVEADDRRLGTEAREKLEAIATAERPYVSQRAAWEAQRDAARARVTELIEHGKAGTAVCQTCGQTIGREQAITQLAAARARLKELEAGEPKVPLAIDREKAALERIRIRQTELDWDPSFLNEARRQLAELERTAARGEAIAAARSALETAKTTTAEATAELARIATAGEQVAASLAEAKAKVAGLAGLHDERARLQGMLAAVGEQIRVLEGERREAERALAQAEASVARLEQLIAERDELTARLAGAELDLARLRRLVGAFGVRGIPARVVESVLPELVEHANELLGQLRPGMTLDLRATRAKADGSGTIEALDIWIRDQRGERQRWSGGEGTSIAMSIAVALSRLGAARSGARVATLVIDEPDGLDSESRRAFGQALRVLAHRGDLERVAVITHQDGIPDFADDVVELEPVIESIDSIGLVA
jgi:exonuclease SbcC